MPSMILVLTSHAQRFSSQPFGAFFSSFKNIIMAKLLTGRISMVAKLKLRGLAGNDPENFRFDFQTFVFPTDAIAQVQAIANAKPFDYNLSDDTTLNILYSVQNDTVKVWGETDDWGSTFSFTLSELQARELLEKAGMGKNVEGYMFFEGEESSHDDRSYSIYDLCEGVGGIEPNDVAECIFKAWLLEGENAELTFDGVTTHQRKGEVLETPQAKSLLNAEGKMV